MRSDKNQSTESQQVFFLSCFFLVFLSTRKWGEGHSHYGDGIVVENGRHIFRREFVCGVADEKTCLANGTVADDNAPGSELQG